MELRNCIRIGIIGSGVGKDKLNPDIYNIALRIGQLIAEVGALLVCGGLGGIMEVTSKGAKQKNGVTIGILPSNNIRDANNYIDIPIATSIGEARNLMVVINSNVIIAINGGFGTLSEIAFARKLKVPIVAIDTGEIAGINLKTISGLVTVSTPEDAIKMALKSIKK